MAKKTMKMMWQAMMCAGIFSVGLSVFGAREAVAYKPSGGAFGLGVGSGTVSTGLSMKYHTGSSLAYQGNVGFRSGWGGWGNCGKRYCRGRYDVLGVSGDVLLEQPALVQAGGFNLAWNVGGGLGVVVADDYVDVAGAFVLGLEFNLEVVPIDLVLEYRPRVFLIDSVDFDLVHLTGQVRFYF